MRFDCSLTNCEGGPPGSSVPPGHLSERGVKGRPKHPAAATGPAVPTARADVASVAASRRRCGALAAGRGPERRGQRRCRAHTRPPARRHASPVEHRRPRPPLDAVPPRRPRGENPRATCWVRPHHVVPTPFAYRRKPNIPAGRDLCDTAGSVGAALTHRPPRRSQGGGLEAGDHGVPPAVGDPGDGPGAPFHLLVAASGLHQAAEGAARAVGGPAAAGAARGTVTTGHVGRRGGPAGTEALR